MNVRKILIVGLLVLLTVPLVGILTAVGWISVLDLSNGTNTSSGQAREYLLYVPDSYDPGEPTPLVISLHAGACPLSSPGMVHGGRTGADDRIPWDRRPDRAL